jgi:hypothetical protein
MKSLPSHVGAAMPRQLGHGVLPSHAGDGVTEVMLAVA